MNQSNAGETAALPSVGIILTTYNGAEFLADQLDSLLAQTGVSVHIYVFDDKSSDDTLAIMQRYADANPGGFTIHENNPNSGGTGLNIFRNVPSVPDHHDYYALADQDDIWLPEKIIRGIDALKAECAGLYFSNLLAWDGGEGADAMLGIVAKSSPLAARDHVFGGGSAGCTYVMTNKFFVHLQELLRPIDLTGVRRISHDWLIYFLARHYGYGVVASPDALIKYRIHTESQYGGMSLGGMGAIKRKAGMLKTGFMDDQVVNALRFAREGTEDRQILLSYTKGRISRLGIILKYRFALVRSKKRLVSMAAAFLIFQ